MRFLTFDISGKMAVVASPLSKFENFFARYKILKYKKGDLVLRPGDTPRGINYIHKGYIRIYSISPTGEELTLIVFKPTDAFPLIWVFTGKSSQYYSEALTPVEIKCVPREDFLEFLKMNPESLFEATTKVLVRMGGLMARMEHLVFGNAYHKVVSILCLCAERFVEGSTQNITLPFPLTHKQLANFIGVSRETASLEMKHLEKEGLINYQGRKLVIKDLKELRKHSLLHDNV